MKSYSGKENFWLLVGPLYFLLTKLFAKKVYWKDAENGRPTKSMWIRIEKLLYTINAKATICGVW